MEKIYNDSITVVNFAIMKGLKDNQYKKRSTISFNKNEE